MSIPVFAIKSICIQSLNFGLFFWGTLAATGLLSPAHGPHTWPITGFQPPSEPGSVSMGHTPWPYQLWLMLCCCPSWWALFECRLLCNQQEMYQQGICKSTIPLPQGLPQLTWPQKYPFHAQSVGTDWVERELLENHPLNLCPQAVPLQPLQTITGYHELEGNPSWR